MKTYFKNLLSEKKHNSYSPSIIEINTYKESLIIEMKKLGATESELRLIQDEMIINSIINDWQVEDLAWAILQ